MSIRAFLKRTFTGPGGLTRLAGGLLLLGTVASQHPNPAFDRVKNKDAFSAVFPNWRFFAPNPAQHDYHLMYRTLSDTGETSRWRVIEVITGRRLRQIAWYPERRPEKAIFDIAGDLVSHVDKGFDRITTFPTYQVLREFVRKQVRLAGADDVKGFQFGLARYTGYDETGDPEIIFVSPYTPLPES